MYTITNILLFQLNPIKNLFIKVNVSVLKWKVNQKHAQGGFHE